MLWIPVARPAASAFLWSVVVPSKLLFPKLEFLTSRGENVRRLLLRLATSCAVLWQESTGALQGVILCPWPPDFGLWFEISVVLCIPQSRCTAGGILHVLLWKGEQVLAIRCSLACQVSEKWIGLCAPAGSAGRARLSHECRLWRDCRGSGSSRISTPLCVWRRGNSVCIPAGCYPTVRGLLPAHLSHFHCWSWTKSPCSSAFECMESTPRRQSPGNSEFYKSSLARSSSSLAIRPLSCGRRNHDEGLGGVSDSKSSAECEMEFRRDGARNSFRCGWISRLFALFACIDGALPGTLCFSDSSGGASCGGSCRRRVWLGRPYFQGFFTGGTVVRSGEWHARNVASNEEAGLWCSEPASFLCSACSDNSSRAPVGAVSRPRCWCCFSSFASGGGGGGLARDADLVGQRRQAQENAGIHSACELSSQPSIRDGGRSPAGARFWICKPWRAARPHDVSVVEAHRDSGRLGSEQEAEQLKQSGGSAGRSKPKLRCWRLWQWKTSCSGSSSLESGVDRPPWRFVSSHREAHVGGLDQSDTDTWLPISCVELSSMGGTSVKDRQLQIYCPCSLGRLWCSGQLVQERHSRSPSSFVPPVVAAGSVCGGPGRMAVGFGVELGKPSAVFCTGAARPPESGKRGASLLTVAGPAVGRDSPSAFERDRRLCQQKKGAESAFKQCGSVHRAKEKSKSQGETESGRQRREPRRLSSTEHAGVGEPPPEVQVPGSSASAVRVSAFVNSLPRWLLRSHCGLSGFLRSIVQCPADRTDLATIPCRGASTWPMPIPFPNEFLKSSRHPDRHRRRLVCLHVVLLDWLHLNKPSAAPKELRIGAKLNPKQWSAVSMLLSLAWDSNTPLEVDAVSMGRSAAKFESFEHDIGALHRAAFDCLRHPSNSYAASSPLKPDCSFPEGSLRSGFLSGKIDSSRSIAAKAIQADRLHFPGPPSFRPQPYMDEATAAVYDAPLKFAALPSSHLGEVPTVRVYATEADKVGLYRKLASSGRLQPVRAEHKRGPYVSGMFSVCKDMEKDRLILDSRPPNILEKKLSVWTATMASAAALCDITLDDDRVLVASGEDLKDYFYQFVTTAERTRRNILSDPLNEEQAEQVFGKQLDWEEFPMYVGLSTMAMGDTNSCEFAQCAHVSICRRAGVFYDHELLSLRGSVPRGLLSVGIIIDDLVVLEKVLRGHFEAVTPRDILESERRLERAVAGYKLAGLETNAKKEFKCELQSRFWGIELDGSKGFVRPSSLRLWPVMLITLRVASLGLCSVGLMEALAGSWISMFSLRRRLMCTMDLVFEALAVSEQKSVIRLSTGMIDELWTLALLGPLAVVNLRAQPCDFLIATDSSLDWTAGVSAELPKPIAAEVMRRSLKRGIWSKLLPPHKAWLREHALLEGSDEVPAESYASHPLWNLLAGCLDFRFNWRRKILKRKHINITELDAHLFSERRCAGSMQSRRLLYGLDSQVSLGALVKGRASSASLNGLLQRSLPYALGADLYGFYIYFPSAVNRADAPTRDKEIPGPDIELRGWWATAAEGDFEMFDEWLAAVEAGVVEPDFDLNLLEPRGQPEMSTGRQNRDESFRRSAELSVPVSRLRNPVSCCVPGQISFEAGADRGLCDEALQILRTFHVSQFFAKTKPFIVREPGALDLYSGKFGVARQLVACGAPWVLTFEIERSSSEDLLDGSVQRRLVRLIELKAVRLLGAAVVCRSFSTAITPPVRSLQFLRGLPTLSGKMKDRVVEGNRQADRLAELLAVAELNGCSYWFENPDLSWLFKQRRFRDRYGDKDSDFLFRFCMCRFGTPWRKATRIGTDVPGLRGLRLPCVCKRRHLVLRGRSAKHRKNWTAVAQPYPQGLCKLIALGACVHLGWSQYKKLDIGACCRAGSQRVGEASNPGPRYSQVRSGMSLQNVQLRTPATEALEARQLEAFFSWSQQQMPSTDVQLVYKACPGFLGEALCVYGVRMFETAGALSNYRHLILALQRWSSLFRVHASRCWELVAKWELCEPVSHRPPIPSVVVKSLICLGLQLGWRRWCGVTLLAFYGAGRIGEVLKCKRSDLLFPEDALDVSSNAVFLQLKQFKSLGRQPSRVQHMKVADEQACKLLEGIFLKFPDDVALYPFSAGVYRRRWDKLLALLEIPVSAKITPGGLRGGAAVQAYKNGMGVQDILWKMRLRNQQTLESYLQEVAAIGALRDLRPQVRRRLHAFSAIFDHLDLRTFRDPTLGQWPAALALLAWQYPHPAAFCYEW